MDVVAVGALVLSCINSLAMVIEKRKNLSFEINDWYINDNPRDNRGKHYLFHFAFVNKSTNPISVSAISLKYEDEIIKLDYEQTTILSKPVKDAETNEVLYINRLYSKEIPFLIEGLGVTGGYLGKWNLPNPKYLHDGAEIEVTLHTNRGKVKKKLKLPNIKNISEVQY